MPNLLGSSYFGYFFEVVLNPPNLRIITTMEKLPIITQQDGQPLITQQNVGP